MPTPIATLSGSASPSCLNSQHEIWSIRRRCRFLGAHPRRAFQQDPELVAADAGHHVAVADALGKQVRDLDQRFVAGPVPERVVDHLEPVDVDEQHRRPTPVTVDSRNEPLQLAHEAAPIRKIDQRIQMRQLVELLNALLQPGHLAPQCTDLFDQPVTIIDVDDVGQLIRHLPRALALACNHPIARFYCPENAGTLRHAIHNAIRLPKLRLPSQNRPPKRAASYNWFKAGQ